MNSCGTSHQRDCSLVDRHPAADLSQPPMVRGDGEWLSMDQIRHQSVRHQHQHQQQQQHDKCTCQCGPSRAEELNRLETRLAVMESRLADFEVLLKSLSGDTTGQGESATCGDRPGEGTKRSDCWGEGPDGEGAPVSTADASAPLNLMITDNRSSSTWTDLGLLASRASKSWQQGQEQQKQQKQQKQQEEQQGQPEEPVSAAESFDLLRFSTQDTMVHQQHDLVTCSSGCLDDAASSSLVAMEAAAVATSDACWGGDFKRQHNFGCMQPILMQRASNVLLTTVLGRAEQLVLPRGEQGSRGLLEPGAPREIADPPSSVGVSRSCLQEEVVCHQLPYTHPDGFRSGLGPCSGAVLMDKRMSSSETAMGECAVDLIVRSRVSRVRHGADSVATLSQKPPLAVCQAAAGAQDEAAGMNDLATSTGTTATQSQERTPSDTLGSQADCHLCADLLPYARRRLSALESGGALQKSKGVCIQRSGFSQLDTVFIAGLALKAAALFESEGDQASFVRLKLRKMGFECAVVIGRHFTGCICSLDSSRLLVDIGDMSCLVFSLFKLSTELSQLPSAK